MTMFQENIDDFFNFDDNLYENSNLITYDDQIELFLPSPSSPNNE